MGGCSAPDCHNRWDKGFRLFSFPEDLYRRSRWLQNCRRENWLPTRYSRICEAHFDESQFEIHRKDGLRKLKPNAIPTIFNVGKPQPKQPKVESCVFRECKNRNVKLNTTSKRAQLLFFPFPTDPRLKHAWMQAAARTPEVSGGSEPKICSEHFFPEEFEVDRSGRIKLKPYAIPIVLNTTIIEEELAPKRKKPRTSKELRITLNPARVVIPSEERRLAEEKLLQQLEEDIETHEETMSEETRDLASPIEVSETESLRSATSPPPSRPSSAVPPEDSALPSLQLLSFVASRALQESKKSSSPQKRTADGQAQNSKKTSCGAIENFITKVSKKKLSRTKSRSIVIKEQITEGGENKMIDITASLPSIFIYDDSSKIKPTESREYADLLGVTTKGHAFDEELEKMSVADVEAKHTGVRLKISILNTKNDALLCEVHRLKKIIQQLIARVRRHKDNITKSVDNLLVVETAPRCGCSKNREPPEAPREDLDAIFSDVAAKEVPTAEECQLHIDHQETLIKRINNIKNTFKDRGKDIVRVVVIQSEDLTCD